MVRFTTMPWLYHTLRVYHLTGSADRQWALDNLHAWKSGRSDQDGRWVHLPDSAAIVSDVVDLHRIDVAQDGPETAPDRWGSGPAWC